MDSSNLVPFIIAVVATIIRQPYRRNQRTSSESTKEEDDLSSYLEAIKTAPKF